MARRRATEEEPAREEEASPHSLAPTAPQHVLDLQQAHGNAAVARAILARQAGATATATAATEEDLERAFFQDDWDEILRLYLADPKLPRDRFDQLDAEELRYLHDAVTRANQERSWVGAYIQARFAALKVPEKEREAGAGWGEVDFKVSKIEDGDPRSRPRKQFKYTMEIEFMPSPKAMGAADEIAFIQTVQVVDQDTWENRSNKGTERMTEEHTKVDRLQGKEQGWYGMNDDESGGRTMRPWKKSDFDEPAFMQDTPKAARGNRHYHFETAVVCRKGYHAGKVYATVHWGFAVDDDLVITPYDTEVFNKPTEEFEEAVEKWNEQAAGPEAKRNATDQKPLPSSLR